LSKRLLIAAPFLVWLVNIILLQRKSLGFLPLDHDPNAHRHDMSVMIIASRPKSHEQYATIWSQLECFAEKFDQVILATDHQFKEAVFDFMKEIHKRMPEIGKKLKTEFYTNNRYDTGLWCDSLTKGKLLKLNEDHKDKTTTNKEINFDIYDSATSQYKNFFLINDSLLALEKSNELLDALISKNASLVSLNYWGNKLFSFTYWLESPARAFSLDGIKIFANALCTLPSINHNNWWLFCPRLFLADMTDAEGVKRCIAELTEISLVKHFPLEKVHGLYPSKDPGGKHWIRSFKYWEFLRQNMSFPVMKVKQIPHARAHNRSHEFKYCTNKMKKWQLN